MKTPVTLTLELSPEAAAGLKRFAEKVSFTDAAAVLFPHIKANIRSEQAHDIITAFGVLDRALTEAGVCSWPWLDSGRP